MQRNGKTQHGTSDTQVLMGTPSKLAGVASEHAGVTSKLAGVASEHAGVTSKLAGVASEDAGVASKLAGVASEDAGVTSKLAGVASEGAGVLSAMHGTSPRRLMAGFTAKASVARRVVSAQLVIDTVLNDTDLLKLLSTHGYDAERMAEGKALRDQAEALQYQRLARTGARYGATDARNAAHKQAHATYMHNLGVARVALRGERAAAQKLGLVGSRQTTQAGWQHQAQQFYTNALADTAILHALERYNLDQAQLEAGQASVAAVADGAVAQQITRSAAQETTRARNAALQALNRWMQDFNAIARLALADQPQRLAELGLAGR